MTPNTEELRLPDGEIDRFRDNPEWRKRRIPGNQVSIVSHFTES